MFEQFSENAINAITLAKKDSLRLGHNFIGTEQLLFGLIAQESGKAAKTLADMGVTLQAAIDETEKIIGHGVGCFKGEIPFTPRAKRVLELSRDEAKQLGHSCIDTEHILLSIIKEGNGVGARVLENLDTCLMAILKKRRLTLITAQKI